MITKKCKLIQLNIINKSLFNKFYKIENKTKQIIKKKILLISAKCFEKLYENHYVKHIFKFNF